MRKRNCNNIQDLLLDYVDGVLPAEESRLVAGHLNDCAACRETAADLRRSLSLAQAIWRDNLESGDTHENQRQLTRVNWFRYAAAAGILIAAGALLFVTSHHGQEETTFTSEQLQQQIERAATAARLLAATNLIAQCEGTESIVARQHRYIVDRYGDTPAAVTLRANKQTLMKGMQND